MEAIRKHRLYKKGRYLIALLRHKPEKENFKVDKFGFVSVQKVCKALDITNEELDYIVETNNKKRFIYNENHDKIRATQGHSIKIKLPLEPVEPPDHLYHGTSIDKINSIWTNGLEKGKRNHVHLSMDKETAFDVGLRHARLNHKVRIITVSAKLMHDSGYKFYNSENGVWLIDHVPIRYMEKE